MDPLKSYRVEPLVGAGSAPFRPFVFEATGDFHALAHLHKVLDATVAFALYEGKRLVMTCNPSSPAAPRR